MQGQQRHHALAMPEDVEAWSVDLLSAGSARRAHDYWIRVNRFYDWLQWHTEHPHRYNPALMAAAEGDATGEVWNWKAERTLDRREYHRRTANE
jgi:hypothetical protein